MHVHTETALAPTGLAMQPRVAILVPEDQRLDVLQRIFGLQMLIFEFGVCYQLSHLSKDQTGGDWNHFTFGDLGDGFYMAPVHDELMSVSIESNGYRNRMSADAAGIVTCLLTYANFNIQYPAGPYAKLYHRLLGHAALHAEAAAIFRAID